MKYILCGNTPELEVLHLLFRHPKSNFFFNDFYLDEVLNKNPMARLEEFVHTNGCLTLISGLKLFSARPKLKTRKSQFKTKRSIMMKNLALGCELVMLSGRLPFSGRPGSCYTWVPDCEKLRKFTSIVSIGLC